MNYGRRLHPDDSKSTYLLVKKLQEEEFNAVLLYKPQGDKIVIGPKIYNELDVGKNLFAIGLQTKQQLDVFIKHSNKIVCIDSTHETNQYEFPLVILVVADEFNKGYPVELFISNHADELSLRPFLEEIKKRCPEDLKINTVMTDDDSSGWNAFTNVFGSVEHHLLRKWHITRAWGRKLSKLAPKKEVKNELYRALLVLLEEKDPLQFEMLMNSFLSICNEKSSKFGEYFQINYKDCAKQWAMCYRILNMPIQTLICMWSPFIMF